MKLVGHLCSRFTQELFQSFSPRCWGEWHSDRTYFIPSVSESCENAGSALRGPGELEVKFPQQAKVAVGVVIDKGDLRLDDWVEEQALSVAD